MAKNRRFTIQCAGNCKRNTQIFPYCWQHAEQILNVRVQKSHWLPDGHHGLYASRPGARGCKIKVFSKNDVIVEYLGEHINHDELSKRYDSVEIVNGRKNIVEGFAEYTLQYAKDAFVDAQRLRGYAAYINDPSGHIPLDKKPNAKFDGLNVVATKNIYNGDEILVSYGKQYWQ